MRHRLTPSRSGDWYLLVGPYDSRFVDLLTASVPVTAREWRPVAKAWRIAPEYVEIVQAIIAEIYGPDGT